MGRKRAYAQKGTYEIKSGSHHGGGRLPGATISIPDHEGRNEQLGLSVVASPFKHAKATVPEWVIAISGPTRLLERVDRVVYDYEDDKKRSADVRHRWGEFFEHFEHRAFGTKAPKVTATVHMRNGTKLTLKN